MYVHACAHTHTHYQQHGIHLQGNNNNNNMNMNNSLTCSLTALWPTKKIAKNKYNKITLTQKQTNTHTKPNITNKKFRFIIHSTPILNI
jgi:hypothetical protein